MRAKLVVCSADTINTTHKKRNSSVGMGLASIRPRSRVVGTGWGQAPSLLKCYKRALFIKAGMHLLCMEEGPYEVAAEILYYVHAVRLSTGWMRIYYNEF